MNNQHNDPHTEWVDLTPELAIQWLGKNIKNRNRRTGRVNSYAQDITDKLWLQAGDPIRFDWNGVMFDGQHRCQAVIRSGRTIRVLVIRGLDPAVRDVIDSGIARTMSDRLRQRGLEQGGPRAQLARLVYLYETGRHHPNNDHKAVAMTPASQLRMTAREDIEAALEIASGLYKKCRPQRLLPLPLGAFAFCYWLLSSRDDDEAFKFLGDFALIASSRPIECEMTQQICQAILRRLNIDAMKKSVKGSGGTLMLLAKIAYVVRGWNHFRDEQPVTMIRMNTDVNGFYTCPDPV